MSELQGALALGSAPASAERPAPAAIPWGETVLGVVGIGTLVAVAAWGPDRFARGSAREGLLAQAR